MNKKMTLQLAESLAKHAQIQVAKTGKMLSQVTDVFIYCFQGLR